jgi:hypothetical protein
MQCVYSFSIELNFSNLEMGCFYKLPIIDLAMAVPKMKVN